MHRNIVMSETLQAIESVVLFSFANYFLRFTEAYKRIHSIEGEMDNNWYEFIEYGTINKLTIFLQRNGFSRETALFIRKNRNEYVVGLDDSKPVKLTFGLSVWFGAVNEPKDKCSFRLDGGFNCFDFVEK